MKIKCRYHCHKAVHIHSLHLYGLSLENFRVEVSEIFRFLIRARKILTHLGFIALVIYMVGFVGGNATTFMFVLSIFVER